MWFPIILRPAFIGVLLVVASDAFSSRAFLTQKRHEHSNIQCNNFFGHHGPAMKNQRTAIVMSATSNDNNNKLEMIEGELEPIPFTESSPTTSKGEPIVECYVDAIATIDNTQYMVGHTCDHAIDIVFIDEEDELVPIEIEDDLMDDIFPMAAKAMKEEFPDCTLRRTPASLTLEGDLGEEDEEDDEATAELLVTFEYDGTEYNVVRPFDLMLLVATTDENNPEQNILIDDEKAEEVMPTLMEMLGL